MQRRMITPSIDERLARLHIGDFLAVTFAAILIEGANDEIEYTGYTTEYGVLQTIDGYTLTIADECDFYGRATKNSCYFQFDIRSVLCVEQIDYNPLQECTTEEE